MIGLDALLQVGGKLIDKLIPDPEAKARAQFELTKMAQDGELAKMANDTDLYKTEQNNLTDRLKSDMSSDSWLSKNIRPLVMIYLLVLVTCAGFNWIHATGEFIAMIKSFTEYGLMFYFGGRTVEKISSMAASVIKGKGV